MAKGFGFDVLIDGAEQEIARLHKFNQSLKRGALKPAYKAVAEAVKARALPLVPVGETRKLRGGLKATGLTKRGKVYIKRSIKYGRVIHQGYRAGWPVNPGGSGTRGSGSVKGNPFILRARNRVESDGTSYRIFVNEVQKIKKTHGY